MIFVYFNKNYPTVYIDFTPSGILLMKDLSESHIESYFLNKRKYKNEKRNPYIGK